MGQNGPAGSSAESQWQVEPLQPSQPLAARRPEQQGVTVPRAGGQGFIASADRVVGNEADANSVASGVCCTIGLAATVE